MLEEMKAIVKNNDLCVLATSSEGVPHCSLMSYLSDEDVCEIYLVSHRETKKYLNLVQNPQVSLLIDTRDKVDGRTREKIKALTVKGEFQILHDPDKKEKIRTRFLLQHPHLADFLNDPTADIFSIRIKSFQLLDGIKDIFIERLD
jgi:nitroimidazol reductase NimA-like FMN-containing flavoprotein (pyridoxamine 5'-phosphate oxidase superfamily)